MGNEKVTEICSKLLNMFASGELPPAVSRTVITRQQGDDKPSQRWSFGNQLLMIIAGTEDARGFRQWQQVNRTVKKGAKAIYILAPLTKRVTRTSVDQVTQQEVQEELSLIKGFRPVPVFKLEDTEGEPVPVADYRPPQLPPLYEVAEHFGMVRYSSYFDRELGSCSIDGTIRLYSADVDVFFHELGHLVHGTIRPLKGGQHPDQELLAEMVSCVLCEMYGIQGYEYQGWKYMNGYVGEDPVKTLRAIMGVLNDVDAVVMKILTVDHELSIATAI